MESSASEPSPGNEEEDVEAAGPGNKLALDNLAEVFQLVKKDFDLFYDMDPSRMWALKLKQTQEKGLVSHRNILREMKTVRQKLRCISAKLRQVCLPLLPPLLLPPLRQQDQPSCSSSFSAYSTRRRQG